MLRATIALLAIYPVKGCRGIEVSAARVAARGLVAAVPMAEAGDREWMIVDRDGRFVSQREHPGLALIETSLAPGALVLAAPGAAPLAVDLAPARAPAHEVVVWDSRVPAHDAGDDAARWLSMVVGADVRLVRFDRAHRRRCNPDYAGASGAHTAFADGYPLLVIGSASLDDLNARLAAKGSAALPMNRFRPNIVLDCLEPYDEDHVGTVVADGITLKLVKPCTRCQVTTTDQSTGNVGIEPLATLAGYRTHAALGGVAFGMNAIVVAGEGSELAVGGRAECNLSF